MSGRSLTWSIFSHIMKICSQCRFKFFPYVFAAPTRNFFMGSWCTCTLIEWIAYFECACVHCSPQYSPFVIEYLFISILDGPLMCMVKYTTGPGGWQRSHIIVWLRLIACKTSCTQQFIPLVSNPIKSFRSTVRLVPIWETAPFSYM